MSAPSSELHLFVEPLHPDAAPSDAESPTILVVPEGPTLLSMSTAEAALRPHAAPGETCPTFPADALVVEPLAIERQPSLAISSPPGLFDVRGFQITMNDALFVSFL